MKIWLPIKASATGGSSSFAHKFKAGMEKRGHVVILGADYPADFEVMLVSPRAPFSLVRQAWRNKKMIIHRLDGAYYPATPAGWLFPAYNAALSAIQYLSHHTIYQSRYAKWICQRLVGPRAASKTSIIYNGVDTIHFSPDGPAHSLRGSADQHVFFTAQQFRRRDQLAPLLQALVIYREYYNSSAKLAVAGDFVGAAASFSAELKKNPAVQLLGPVGNDQLPQYLRAADAFLYCHPNPACPNNVLEAMACGVPIVGIADGAMPELVRDGQDGYLVTLTGGGHLFPRRFDAMAFAAAMHQAVENKEQLGQSAREQVLTKFTLDRMTEQYERMISRVHS